MMGPTQLPIFSPTLAFRVAPLDVRGGGLILTPGARKQSDFIPLFVLAPYFVGGRKRKGVVHHFGEREEGGRGQLGLSAALGRQPALQKTCGKSWELAEEG